MAARSLLRFIAGMDWRTSSVPTDGEGYWVGGLCLSEVLGIWRFFPWSPTHVFYPSSKFYLVQENRDFF